MPASMQPVARNITIGDNVALIKQLIRELVVDPRDIALKWAQITKQTANIKIGYPGQHLASLITGVEGEKTGARGNDLKDGSEVKSCSRIDQLDKCRDCGAPVARYEAACASCESTNIDRKNDSKWLFTIRSQDDLDLLVDGVPRVLLVIGDYPYFDNGKYDVLRFQAFEIWNGNPRSTNFKELMTNYYNNIYLTHKEAHPEKTPAPKNFWPFSYQFYMCNPIKTFECHVDLSNGVGGAPIEILRYIEPGADRSPLESELMPHGLLTRDDVAELLKNVPLEVLKEVAVTHGLNPNQSGPKILESLPGIPEKLRGYLSLRDDRTATAKRAYTRRAY